MDKDEKERRLEYEDFNHASTAEPRATRLDGMGAAVGETGSLEALYNVARTALARRSGEGDRGPKDTRAR